MGLHGFELYPIQAQVIAWAVILVLIAYYACAKIEIVMDRSKCHYFLSFILKE